VSNWALNDVQLCGLCRFAGVRGVKCGGLQGGGYVAGIWKTRNAFTSSLVGMEFEYRLDWQIIRNCVVMGYVVWCEVEGVCWSQVC